MTGFKNKLFAFLLCLCASQAAAQSKIYLVPPVQLLPLKKMETNAYGLIIADKEDVLNENLWKDTAYPLIASKFSQISNALPAKAEELRLNLLKLAADPPQGTTDQSFITLKLQTLFDLGQFDDVYKLIQKIPEKTRTEVQNKIYADVLLIKNLPAACFLTDRESKDSFWQKLSAVCAALNHEENKTFLILDLLKEQGETDSFITAAADHFLYKKSFAAVPDKITPLTAAVWRQSGHSLAELKDPAQQIWYKTMFVQDETIPVEKRLAAAEELVQSGILAPSKLRTYYQQASFKKAALTNELKRARYVQQAAELSSRPDDNIKKQYFIKQGLISAKEAHISYAFSAAAKDILKTLKPDLDTLSESAELIEAFTLAGLYDQAIDWQKKAEILFPVSKTTAYGWYFAELGKPDKSDHLFIPALENMMACAEKQLNANKKFIARIDRLMLVFKTLDMIQPDDLWHYSSFEEESAEDDFAYREKQPVLQNRPVGDIVFEALRELNGTYIGLLNALTLLTEAGLDREAADIAAQSMDIVLNPVLADE